MATSVPFTTDTEQYPLLKKCFHGKIYYFNMLNVDIATSVAIMVFMGNKIVDRVAQYRRKLDNFENGDNKGGAVIFLLSISGKNKSVLFLGISAAVHAILAAALALRYAVEQGQDRL
jgi:NADH:ubiquinone oxidoreductase subunit 3 (subunit A)